MYDFTTNKLVNLYLGTIFENPEDIYCEGQFVAGRIFLDQKPTYDFIDLKWDTIALSLKDLDYQCLKPSKYPDGRNPK